ncbi:hypothetical protein C8R44DRAFT_864993 [Mycena epipterygia]|nr:hypothetical protein C8R44DRAFT_864993 [Mycena epipterygia]
MSFVAYRRIFGRLKPWRAPLISAKCGYFTPSCPKIGIDLAFMHVASNPSLASNFNAVLDLVRESRSIQAISLYTLDWETLDHAGRLRSLRSLDLVVLPTTLPPIPYIYTFPALQKFVIASQTTVQAITCFFRACRRVPLVSINICFEVEVPPTASETQDLYCALVAGCSHSSLTKLTLSIESEDRTDDLMIPSKTLQILHRFTNLTLLWLAPGFAFNLDDDAIAGMARAWRRIKRLFLTSRRYPMRPNATLQCLHSFAQYCPDLDTLEIGLDASGVTMPTNGGKPAISQQRLHTLYVPSSPISMPRSVAEFLSGLFPHLRTIGTDRVGLGDDDEEDILNPAEVSYAKGWTEAASLLSSFATKGDGNTQPHAPVNS